MFLVRRSHWALTAIAMMSLTIGLRAPAGAGELVPLKGTFVGSGDFYSGQFAHLGRYVAQMFPNQSPHAIWTAANGDMIFNDTVAYVPTPTGVPGIYTFVQPIVIIGGTGRFAGASGTATFTGIFNENNTTFYGEINGILSTPGANKKK